MRWTTLITRLTAGLVIVPQLAVAAAPAASWYAPTLSAFADAGYVDANGFVAGKEALRAEFVELTLRLLGNTIHVPFGEPIFDDADLQSPFFVSFQEGGRGNWVTGIGNCAGRHPCAAAPLRTVNRAEAAALIVRAFGLTRQTASPTFSDNPPNQWYTEIVTTAASRCILQGDTGTHLVRPGGTMNRAEMLSMLLRAARGLVYPDCNPPEAAALPVAKKEFTIVQTLPSSSNSASSLSASASSPAASVASSTSSVSASSSSSAAASSPSAAAVSSASSSAASSSSSSIGAASSSSLSSSVSAQDPHFNNLVLHFQQYMTSYSNLLTRARSAEGDQAVQLLTVLRAQIDLLNQLYPFVEMARNRVLTQNEWSDAVTLETRIESGFAQAP